MPAKEKTRYTTVDEYLALQTPEAVSKLKQLRRTIKKAAPKAEELISYSIPAFKYHGMVAWFAAAKNHCGLYMRPGTLNAYRDELRAYSMTKSAIHFPYNKPIPGKVVTELIKHQVKQNLEKEQLKAMSKINLKRK